MARLSTIAWGAERFRFGPWQADGRVAYLAGFSAHPTVAAIDAALERLRVEGYRSVVTSAMHPEEIPGFLAAGFTRRERLVVLQRAISRREEPPRLSVRRCGIGEIDQVLRVDHAAFSSPWQLDGAGIREALRATPRARIRVSDGPSGIAGYAICGKAGRTGYLQRLAVDPPSWGQGVARALIADALRWLSRNRARGVLVNTQESNQRAIELYRDLGFQDDRTHLMVLEREL